MTFWCEEQKSDNAGLVTLGFYIATLSHGLGRERSDPARAMAPDVAIQR